MERNEIRSPDHIVYVVASLTMLALLAFFASQSVIVVHRIELPVLRFQAELFSRLFPGTDYEVESYRIQSIKNALDAEFAKKNSYPAIRKDMLKKAVRASSVHTRDRTRILVSILLGSFGLIMIGTVMRVRGRLYETRESIRPFQGNGVEGFVRLVGQHLDPGMVELVKRSPTPRHLVNAFAAAREKVNIPCSVAARLFPRGSQERLAVLEYGKAKVTFAEGPEERSCNA